MNGGRLRDGLPLYCAVAAGAALGGLARTAVSVASAGLAGPGFPWGTLAVNLLGSFAIGFYASMTGPGGCLSAGARAQAFVMTGFCGGFTTFSLFSLEAVLLAGEGRPTKAALLLSVSVAGWLLAAWAGHAVAARLNRLGGRSAPR